MSQENNLQQMGLFPTSLPEDSPAKTLVLQETRRALAQKPAAAYGLSAPVYLGKFDRTSPFLKMSQLYCLVEEPEASGFNEFSSTFPRSGIAVSGIASVPASWVHTITETEFG